MFHPSFWADFVANPFYGYPCPEDWYLQQLGLQTAYPPILRNYFIDAGYGMFEGTAQANTLNQTWGTSTTRTGSSEVQRVNDCSLQPWNMSKIVQNSEKDIRKDTKRPPRTPSTVPKQCSNRNTESNICNQALGFLILRKRSESTLRRILKASDVQDTDAILRLYYAYANPLKRYQRKYLNRKFLLRMCTETDSDPLQEVRNCGFYREDELSLGEFTRLTRILVKHFLDVVSPLTVLSSKKLQKSNRTDVLKRRHEIRRFLQESTQKHPRH